MVGTVPSNPFGDESVPELRWQDFDELDDLGFIGSGVYAHAYDDEPRPPWYRLPTAVGALAAIGVAVIAIVVSAVLLVTRDSRDTTPNRVEQPPLGPALSEQPPLPTTSAPPAIATPPHSENPPPPPSSVNTTAPAPAEPPRVAPTTRQNPNRPQIDVTRTPISVQPQPRRPPQY